MIKGFASRMEINYNIERIGYIGEDELYLKKNVVRRNDEKI